MQAGPGFLTTFLYYFATTAIVFTIVAAKATGLEISTGIPQQLGALGGVLIGLSGAYFNRSMMLTVQFTNRQTLIAELDTLLTPLGFQLRSDEDNILIYARSGLSQWFSGKIFVQLDSPEATIATRASMMRRIRAPLEQEAIETRARKIKQERKEMK
jgi:hypothetical protein